MIQRKHKKLLLGLLFAGLSTQPVMALSPKALQQHHGSSTEEMVEIVEPSRHSTRVNHSLPELIGPRLYLYLLQSDQFITLQGVAESLWEKYMVKKP